MVPHSRYICLKKDHKEDCAMRNILVVDDDYHMRAALTEVLAEAGYGVCSAEDGRLAMESMKKTPYDLVITDVKMPYLNGIDLLGRIKKEQCISASHRHDCIWHGRTCGELRSKRALLIISRSPLTLRRSTKSCSGLLDWTVEKLSAPLEA